MHHTAQTIMRDYAGHFPTSYDALLKLKGIGEYTAAAIASFAGDEPKASVDGNVFRLLSRYFGIDIPINTPKGKIAFVNLANQMMDYSQPGVYNQAMMEFGSLQCKPQNPDCARCPIQFGCYANKMGMIHLLPVKLKIKKIRERYFNFIIIRKNDSILMNKRGPNDIWQNLYELPLFETEKPVLSQQLIHNKLFIKAFGDKVMIRSVSNLFKHLLSHQKLFIQFIEIENFSELYQDNTKWFYVPYEELNTLAQPKPIFEFLEKEFQWSFK